MEDDRPDLEIVYSSDIIEEPADEAEENYATILRNITKKLSGLPSDQAAVVWAGMSTNSREEAIEESGFTSDEFDRLFNEANAALYLNQQSDLKISKPGHPSTSGDQKGGLTLTGEAEIILFPRTPKPDKPPQP